MKQKKTYFPISIPNTVKPGDRYELLKEQRFNDKTFPIGSKVTYLKIGKKQDYGEYYYRWPEFQFDGDNHKNRILSFEDLKRI